MAEIARLDECVFHVQANRELIAARVASETGTTPIKTQEAVWARLAMHRHGMD